MDRSGGTKLREFNQRPQKSFCLVAIGGFHVSGTLAMLKDFLSEIFLRNAIETDSVVLTLFEVLSDAKEGHLGRARFCIHRPRYNARHRR
jgi:spore maturation protein SpmB